MNTAGSGPQHSQSSTASSCGETNLLTDLGFRELENVVKVGDIAFDVGDIASTSSREGPFSYNHTRIRWGRLWCREGEHGVVVKEASVTRAQRETLSRSAVKRIVAEARAYEKVGTAMQKHVGGAGHDRGGAKHLLRCFGVVASDDVSRQLDADHAGEQKLLGLVTEACYGGALSGLIYSPSWMRAHSSFGGHPSSWLRSEVLPTLKQIALAMECLHEECNFCHRDLKPTNVFLKRRHPYTNVDATGGVHDFHRYVHDIRVADFDSARALDADGTLLEKGVGACGTLAYMAPEVLREGDVGAGARTETPRLPPPLKGKPADVYSFGVLAWELLER